MANVSIRTAEVADREAIQRVWEAAGLSRAAPDEWEALTAGTTTMVLVAVDVGEVVGVAVASFDGWRAYLYHVAVAEQHRRRGIGHDLMERAERDLLSAGARHVYVMVNQENTEGLALVGSRGYLPEDEIVLVKRLATRVA
ncbi:MAG: GNAT family N-acetyltransferase [Chloroflexi bacterium]|nr:GNAT family N-acetyltransferase [Chloroflexota bacterium]